MWIAAHCTRPQWRHKALVAHKKSAGFPALFYGFVKPAMSLD